MVELKEWESFNVIVGAAAGALIGLQFVVLTLISERPKLVSPAAGSAFISPAILHFTAALFLCAFTSMPWESMTGLTILWTASGLAGCAYILFVIKNMRAQSVYTPVLEDWLFHVAIPFAAYLCLPVAAFCGSPHTSLFIVAAGILGLVWAGIHNAWDTISFHVYNQRSEDQ